MKLLISIVFVALIVYAVYTAKYLSSRAKKVCIVIVVISGVLPIIGIIAGIICDFITASKATEWFPILWMLGGGIGMALSVVLVLILGIIVIIYETICRFRNRSQDN